MYFTIHLFKNKYLDFQLSVMEGKTNIFNIHSRWNRMCDHAGIKLTLEIFKLFLNVEIYDNRHWDDDKNSWTN